LKYGHSRPVRRLVDASWAVAVPRAGRLLGQPRVLDHVRGLLADHERHRVGVPARYQRHDGRVDHAQAADAADPELGVDDRVRVRVRSHLARAHLVVQVGGQLSDRARPVRVGRERLVLAARERHRQQRGTVLLERPGLAHRDRLQDANGFTISSRAQRGPGTLPTRVGSCAPSAFRRGPNVTHRFRAEISQRVTRYGFISNII